MESPPLHGEGQGWGAFRLKRIYWGQATLNSLFSSYPAHAAPKASRVREVQSRGASNLGIRAPGSRSATKAHRFRLHLKPDAGAEGASFVRVLVAVIAVVDRAVSHREQ